MSDCIFCQIVSGKIPAKKIFEDGDLVAFHDIAPKAKVHFLVVPKVHIASVAQMREEHSGLFGKMIFKGKEIAQSLGLEGWKMLFNVERSGGQVVFHVHLHVLGGGQIEIEKC